MSNPEWKQPDRVERFTVTSLQMPQAHVSIYNGLFEDIDATKLALSQLYNGSAGGSVYDKIYVPPIKGADAGGIGTMFFVIDTFDPKLGVNAEHSHDE